MFGIGGRTLKDDESDGGDADLSWISALDSLDLKLVFVMIHVCSNAIIKHCFHLFIRFLPNIHIMFLNNISFFILYSILTLFHF